MVCMVSRIGRTIASTRSFCDAAMPSRTPKVTARATDTAIRLSVTMAESHMPTTPQNNMAATQNSASRSPPHHRDARATARIVTGQAVNSRKVSTHSRPSPIAPAIALVNQR
jgi:hypothetical protein